MVAVAFDLCLGCCGERILLAFFRCILEFGHGIGERKGRVYLGVLAKSPGSLATTTLDFEQHWVSRNIVVLFVIRSCRFKLKLNTER
jgi:hypothetical protein